MSLQRICMQYFLVIRVLSRVLEVARLSIASLMIGSSCTILIMEALEFLVSKPFYFFFLPCQLVIYNDGVPDFFYFSPFFYARLVKRTCKSCVKEQ